METKAREMRDEISKLREKTERLESEEKAILSGMAERQKEMEQVEKAVGELFTDIGAEITHIKKRIEEFTSESEAPKPIAPREPVSRQSGIEEKGADKRKREIRETSEPQDNELQKTCPMCGGRMNLHLQEEMWMCYVCAYEESKKG